MTAFLIARTSPSGGNAAQATIDAKTGLESKARSLFASLYPERIITTAGIREGRGPTRQERKGR